MTPVEIVRQASLQSLTTEDGDLAVLLLRPPVSAADLRDLEARLPCPVPDDVRDLLSFCSGFTGGALDLVDFTGKACLFEYEPAFPHGLPIAADGYGNFWVVDLLPTSTTWGPIYFACHDAPVILYQSATLAEFLSELLKLSVPPYKSVVGDVRGDRLFEVWRKNPGVREFGECLASGDPDIQAFAERLGSTFQFIDMRHPSVGFGFSWGRYGPNTVVRRHGGLPIFAYEKKRGLMSRLLGRSA